MTCLLISIMTCQLKNLGCRWILLLLASFVLLLVLSPDSYTHQVYGRLDSAMFFMQGHAWAKGMVPYVDFTDSKGPLLFLIYAMGAWLSPTTYHGVFWISVIVYTLIFYFTYRSACLLMDDCSDGRPLAAAVLAVGGAFLPIIHVETRAEDFGCLFISASLWAMLRMVIVRNTSTDSLPRSVRITSADGGGAVPFLTFGIALGATLLIKYTFTAMVFLLWLPAYAAALRLHGLPWWKPLLWTAATFALVVLPFVVYFLVKGALGTFVQSYFLDTLDTVKNISYGHRPAEEPWETRQRIGGQIVMLVLLAAATLPYIIRYRHSRLRFLPALLALSFWLLASLNYIHIHYMQICTPLLLFGAVLLVRRRPRWLLTCVLTLLVVVANAGYQYHHYRNYIGQCCAERDIFNDYSAVVDCYPGCRILFWHCLGNALGVSAEALPACRHWFWQAGATPKMEQAQDNAVYRRVPDFVVVPTTPRRLKALEERGYRRVHPDLTVNLALYEKQ